MKRLIVLFSAWIVLACGVEPPKMRVTPQTFLRVEVVCRNGEGLRLSLERDRECPYRSDDRCFSCTAEQNGVLRADIASAQCRAFAETASAQSFWTSAPARHFTVRAFAQDIARLVTTAEERPYNPLTDGAYRPFCQSTYALWQWEIPNGQGGPS